MSVLPVLITTAAVRPFADWDISVLVASVAGVVLLHAAGNLFNDYFDFRSGVDRKVKGDRNRPGRLLVRSELKPRDIFIEGLLCLILVAPVALFLIWRCGMPILLTGLAGVACLYAYTGPPFQLKYRALGEPLIFLVFGLFPIIGTSYAQVGRLEWQVLLLAIPLGCPIAAVLAGNNIRDREEDQAAGIRTIAQVADGQISRSLYLCLVVLSPLALVLFAMLRLGPFVLIAAPAFLVLVWRPLVAIWSGKRLPDIDVLTARFSTILMLFLFLVLATHGGLYLGQ
jgi:1,4-dihydroxy-2-naphthoate octaprenyltransferase